jgi:transposase
MSKSKLQSKPTQPEVRLIDWREERRLLALTLKEQGHSQRAIAEKLGITESGVSRLLSRAKAGPAGNGSRREKPDSEAVRLVLEVLRSREWTQRRLAEEMSVDERTVRRWIAGQTEPPGPAMKLLQHLKNDHV